MDSSQKLIKLKGIDVYKWYVARRMPLETVYQLIRAPETHETGLVPDHEFYSDCLALGIVGKSSFRTFWACFSRNEWIKTEGDIPFSFPYPNPYCSVARNQFIAASGN